MEFPLILKKEGGTQKFIKYTIWPRFFEAVFQQILLDYDYDYHTTSSTRNKKDTDLK